MLKVKDRIVEGIQIHRPDGGVASFALHTDQDRTLVHEAPHGSFGPGIEDIEAAKTYIALDAADGKLDFKVGGLELARPPYTIFWTNNSAAALMIALMEGRRELSMPDGKKVEVTPEFKNWVNSTMTLELGRPGAPLGE